MKNYMDFFENGTVNGKAYLTYVKGLVSKLKKYFVPDPNAENGGNYYFPNRRESFGQGDFTPVSDAYVQLLNEIDRQLENENAFDADVLSDKRKTLAETFNIWQQQLDAKPRSNVNDTAWWSRVKVEDGDYFSVLNLINADSLWKRQARVTDSMFKNTDNNKMQVMGKDEPLFPAGSPCKEDVLQSTSGSCYMLSGLRLLAKHHPGYIQSRMIDNKDNTVTVYFQTFGPVTVDKSYSKEIDKDAAPWVRILEKAYVAAHLKNMKRDGRKIPEDEYDMTNLFWGQENQFLHDFLPLKNRDLNLLAAPTRDEAKRRFREALIAAKDKNPTIAVGTDKHAISVDGVIERNGKVYLKLYDQWKRTSKEVDADTLLDDNSPYKTLELMTPQEKPPHEYIHLEADSIAKGFTESEKVATEEDYFQAFQVKFKNSITNYMTFDSKLSEDEERTLLAFLRNTSNFENVVKSEFAKLEPGLTCGEMERLAERGSAYLMDTMGKLIESTIKKLENADNNSVLGRLRENLKQPDKIKATFSDLANSEDRGIQPAPRSEEEMTRIRAKLDHVYTKQENERISRSGKNSVEFVAMTDALRDLVAVMHDPSADKKVVKALQERAYIKCNYYQKNKNPLSSYGKARKKSALEAMKLLEEINPTIKTDIYTKNGKEMLVEMACTCAKGAMTKDMKHYTTADDFLQNMGQLKEKIYEYINNPVLQKLGDAISYNGSEKRIIFEKLCQKGPRDTFRDMIGRKLPGVAERWRIDEKPLTDQNLENTLNVKFDPDSGPQHEAEILFRL